MNISFDRLTSGLVLNFATNIFQKLTPLQKKVSIIALACVSYLALFYLARCLASWDLPEPRKNVKPKVNKPEREIPNLEKLDKEKIEKKNNDDKEELEKETETPKFAFKTPDAKAEEIEQFKFEEEPFYLPVVFKLNEQELQKQALQLADIFIEAKMEHEAQEEVKVQKYLQ